MDAWIQGWSSDKDLAMRMLPAQARMRVMNLSPPGRKQTGSLRLGKMPTRIRGEDRLELRWTVAGAPRIWRWTLGFSYAKTLVGFQSWRISASKTGSSESGSVGELTVGLAATGLVYMLQS